MADDNIPEEVLEAAAGVNKANTEETPKEDALEAEPKPAKEPKKKDDKIEPQKVKGQHESSIGLAIGVAIVIAVILVLLGVLAYQNSDVTTDVEEALPKDSSLDEGTSLAPLTDTEVDTTFSDLESDLDELDSELEELGADDLEDNALGL